MKSLDNEKKLREMLWLRHGCGLTGLYGDDGEMQCNNTTVHQPIDFKRDSPIEIEQKLRPSDSKIKEIMEAYNDLLHKVLS